MHNDNPHAAEKLADIIAGYDVLLIDSWGVLHDGSDILPPGKMLVNYIQNYLSNVVILTNSPERKILVREKILTLGLDISPEITIISAGELAYQDMLTKKEYAGKKAYIIDYDACGSYFKGLSVVSVRRIEDAELLIVRSINPDVGKISMYEKEIRTACDMGIPLVIINTDEAAQRGAKILARPGAVLAYCKGNSDIRYYGKPWSLIYSHIDRKSVV